jgi:DNA-binding XRE family transcriptional regulator
MKKGELIKKVDKMLKDKNLNREKLAVLMNCSKQNLITVLTNSDPKLSFCLKLAKTLELNFYSLFEIENENLYFESEKQLISNVKEMEKPVYYTTYQNEVINRLDILIKILENKP